MHPRLVSDRREAAKRVFIRCLLIGSFVLRFKATNFCTNFLGLPFANAARGRGSGCAACFSGSKVAHEMIKAPRQLGALGGA